MDPVSTEASAPADRHGDVVARAGRYYRWARYIISIGLLIGYGSFFTWDGFIAWPRELAKARELEAQGSHAQVKPHSETDIRLQEFLGVALPAAGVALLIWTLYNSRGAYRLSGRTLHVPGHPPVPLESIVNMDKTLWEKKGIAYIEYALTEGEGASGTGQRTGKLKLDDFVYDRTPTDAIVERIESVIAPEEADEPVADGTEAG